LLGNAFDDFQHTADGLAVSRQLVDDPHRLVNLQGQARDAALLRLHQATPTHRFIIDAVGAADCRCRTARHLLRSGRHLVHSRRHLFDLATLAGNGLIALRRHGLHLASLQLDLADGMPDALDQVVNPGHRAVEHLA